MANEFEIVIEEVLIYNLVDGIFYAKIICKNDHKTVEIDARTSDAIAISVRFNCPIYTYEFILSSAGIVIEGNDFVFLENLDAVTPDSGTKQSPTSFSAFTDEELQEKLQEALSDEAYEKAAKIRDEIIKRKSS